MLRNICRIAARMGDCTGRRGGSRWGVRVRTAALRFALALCVVTPVSGQGGGQAGEWRTYGGDLASTRYSPLAQITEDNFDSLELAWRFNQDGLGPNRATPLMVGGVLYFTGAAGRPAVAVDAASGRLLWSHRLDEGERARAAPIPVSRGLAWWSDGNDERILYVTLGYQLVALDAATGQPISSFGRDGIVDLKRGMDQEIDLLTGDVGLTAAPIVVGDVIVIGAMHAPGAAPRSRTNVKGYVRGYDVRTGERLWIFHTIPRSDEFGNDTWLGDSWSYTGHTGVWAQMSADEELGLVYLPVELPTSDYYGGHRPGDNLFSESIVAVDARTGERRWHYQLVHHGLWDFDIPCAPILADITVDGRPIKALAQPTKQGWLYVLDRVTGEPVWPIEERPVPRGDVPGEWYSPTQPFVTRPPAFERQGVTPADLIDFTPEIRAAAEELASRYAFGPLFSPPIVSRPEGPLAVLMLPYEQGGANWPGGSLDPETNMLYVFSSTNIGSRGLLPADPELTDVAYVSGNVERGPAPIGGGGGGALMVEGLPLVKPPWGRITAYDLDDGSMAWQITHGETPDEVRNHPLLEGVEIERTGRPGRAATLVTPTLLVAAEAGVFTAPSGEQGTLLRAYDKATGGEVGAVFVPGPVSGSPMTFLLDGRQYIALASRGELLAYRLPAPGPQ